MLLVKKPIVVRYERSMVTEEEAKELEKELKRQCPGYKFLLAFDER